MILPDINLLIYAHHSRAAHHEQALHWWQECLRGHQGIALAWVVILGFIRISTHPRLWERPMPVEQALGRVEEWLALPHVEILQPGEDHFRILQSLLTATGSAASLTTDAHLAALAIERRLTLYTTDADFTRFRGLKWRNPLRT